MINIIYRSPQGREVIDTAENLKEAQTLVSEYRLAFNSPNVFYSFK